MVENVTDATEFIAKRLSPRRGSNPVATAQAMIDMVTHSDFLGASEEIDAVRETLRDAGPYGKTLINNAAEEIERERKSALLKSRAKLSNLHLVKPEEETN